MAGAPSSTLEFRYEWVENVMVMLHRRGAPAERDWAAMLNQLAEPGPRPTPWVRALAITDGGGPSRSQQRLLQESLPRVPSRTAVVTNSAGARFIVSAVALFNPQIRSFEPAGLDVALAWLDLDPVSRDVLHRALLRLARDEGNQDFATLQSVARGLAGRG